MTASALLSLMISAVVQAGVAVLIAFVWWLVTARGREPFLRWLGWHRPVGGDAGRLWAASLATLVGFTALMALLVPPLSGQTATSQFHGWGWVGLPAVLVYALLQTAFSEETLFRGLVLKRVAVRAGFWAGNATQAVLFGLIHLLPFLAVVGLGPALVIGLVTGGVGAALGVLNERLAGGSLVPGWAVHACANTLAGSLALAGLA